MSVIPNPGDPEIYAVEPPSHAFSRDIPLSYETPQPATPRPLPPVQARLVSLDAYRGLVMILMISAGLRFGTVIKNMDHTPGFGYLHTHLWDRLAYQADHTKWTGCTLWDLIQPGFMFMVGAAMAFSLAKRQAQGQSFTRLLLHALYRSLVLVLLSVFLASNGKEHANWSFTIVLAQIGLGYPFLFLVAWLKPHWQLSAALLVLAGYWGLFALHTPYAPPEMDPNSPGLLNNWPRLDHFPKHWEKHTNIAASADRWLLNQFPRYDGKPFVYEEGGYQTLNFIPSLATMIFGLLAGELLRSRLAASAKLGLLLLGAAAGFASGWALDKWHLCPMVKRIWTPSFALFSTGWVLAGLAVFYLIIDIAGIRKWAYFMVVVGANSIAAYCLSMCSKPWVNENMYRYFGQDIYELPGRAYALLRHNRFTSSPFDANAVHAYGQIFSPITQATVFLLFCWLVLWWMYRNKVLIKI
jgi:heparan-alpha-glucosaminide N-acetyltransferase